MGVVLLIKFLGLVVSQMFQQFMNCLSAFLKLTSKENKTVQHKKQDTISDGSNINRSENTISVSCIFCLYCNSPLPTIQFPLDPYGANFLKAYCSNIKNLNLNIK